MIPLFTAPTVFLVSIVAAAVLIYIPYLAVAYGRFQIGFDMAAPRAQFDKLPPYAQRANWAHQNTLEAFPIFAAAALMAYVTGVNSQIAEIAAITFVVARFLYSGFYIANIPLGRSSMFAIGNLCAGTLFVLSILHG
jgi:uncharacterized MAPEG superfamily protein